jgi:hypothetical protein
MHERLIELQFAADEEDATEITRTSLQMMAVLRERFRWHHHHFRCG